MLKIDSLKELAFIVLTIFLMIGVIGVFVYMVRTEKGSVKMINFLSSIKSNVDKQEGAKRSIDKELLERKKFQKPKKDSVPDRQFDAGSSNPFRSSEE